ncbi:penicillin-binding transpeptidase domain-containing protein [Butyrivibrio fibrisolvens]|uniref:penicillin-binding transpeptidase domain-containing protein n=1 Tax=Butyrivibrio fibrisolvens TaxID=831 RepID=UPI00200B5944|nr:penicillin-binding transpeptidase domain-containing protein [Butyrivibrio fibrisolvens]
MFDDVKEAVLKFITSRFTVIALVMILAASGILYRLFELQIINGESYLESFQLRIEKTKDIQATRGNIYDRNGNLLAYNELANNVVIEDVYESDSLRDENINETINKVIDIVESNGDTVVNDLSIQLDENGDFEYTVEGTTLLRFLADIYGHTTIDQLAYEERTATPDEVMEYLGKKFEIGALTDPEDKKSFEAGYGYTNDRFLKVVTLRYYMSLNSYQKYIDTTIAEAVSDQTVSDIMENSDVLLGVSIEENTARKYVDAEYFALILGYTGKVSSTELAQLQADYPDMDYDSSDTVGKSGIEQAMESTLQGTKGSETVYVDTVGQVLETTNYVEPRSGNDVYLTIDKNLQEACYDILESRLAGILVNKIVNAKTVSTTVKTSDLKIAIYDVYFKLFENSVIDTTHFTEDDAKETELKVLSVFNSKQEAVLEGLRSELMEKQTPYNELSLEYKNYETYITTILRDNNVLVNEDTEDDTYVTYTKDESISLYEYLHYAIAQNWIDITKLSLDSQYTDSEEIYEHIVSYITDKLGNDLTFSKMLYRYILEDDLISGRDCCNVLLEQGVVKLEDSELKSWNAGNESAYTFIINRINNLELTPAQLNLDPCSGSIVITDVNTGDVLALVSYPGYDNNRMANGVDAEYYAKLRADLSTPLYNYATQQRTAPGSTFKPLSATAGLMEGVITTTSSIRCTGTFDKFTNGPHCWIYPSSHGELTVSGGITNSCNCFFYEVGYRLGSENGTYNSDKGLEILKKYCDMYGLTEKSGIEIEESAPIVSTQDAVRSAIGQGTNSFTTVQLARYITTVANSGTCFNLTLIDKTTDSNGNLLQEYSATVRNTVDLPSSYWDAIHSGMRGVVEKRSDYSDLNVQVAGKTGTAQERSDRANHALFVSYAPYNNPEISITTRVAFGYTSSYAAQITRDVYDYYYNVDAREELLDGSAQSLEGGGTGD